jgi:hypothetical protein
MAKRQTNQSDADLGDSVRQARREMWVMLAAWLAFFLWVTIACAALSGDKADDGTVPTFLGMPRWACIGIALPWLAANVFIWWFSFHFMKDTPLEELDAADSTPDSQA